MEEDISDKPYVKYGTQAESSLRRLFKLDLPEYKVHYKDNNMCLNDKYLWAHANLDGWLTDIDGRMGILEIKTTNILQSMQKEKMENDLSFVNTGVNSCIIIIYYRQYPALLELWLKYHRVV